jgi:hypothetical protein
VVEVVARLHACHGIPPLDERAEDQRVSSPPAAVPGDVDDEGCATDATSRSAGEVEGHVPMVVMVSTTPSPSRKRGP